MSLLCGRGKTVATRRRVPIWAFVVDWRLGLAILAAYGALAFGVLRVSKQR